MFFRIDCNHSVGIEQSCITFVKDFQLDPIFRRKCDKGTPVAKGVGLFFIGSEQGFAHPLSIRLEPCVSRFQPCFLPERHFLFVGARVVPAAIPERLLGCNGSQGLNHIF